MSECPFCKDKPCNNEHCDYTIERKRKLEETDKIIKELNDDTEFNEEILKIIDDLGLKDVK